MLVTTSRGGDGLIDCLAVDQKASVEWFRGGFHITLYGMREYLSACCVGKGLIAD